MNYLVPQNNNMNNEKSSKNGIVILLILVVIALACAVFSRNSDSSPFKKANKPYIAAIHIEGVITNKNDSYDQAWLLDTIDKLADDSMNMGIMLVIDSPGGAVYEADEVYLELKRYAEETKRPVYTYMQSLAASGGYYIACASKKIYANRNTLTGSIGVISGQHLDLTGLMEKYGIKSTTITAGRNKNMGNYNQSMTDEQRAIMQSIADECYEQFTDIVAESRQLDINTVKELADGRVYTAKQALANKLVDKIDTWENAVDDMVNTEYARNDIEVTHFRPDSKKSLYKLLMETYTNMEKSKIEESSPVPSAILELFENDVPYPAYLYTGYKRN
ncbi:MAG: signal peptide peptidase SppA [Treponema sp.]|nr:signal peptide peptidase SppA [Treponema sp.]